MPWRAELWVEEGIEPVVEGGTVKVIIPSGSRKLTVRTSRTAARDFAVRLLNALNAADKEQTARVYPFVKECGDEH